MIRTPVLVPILAAILITANACRVQSDAQVESTPPPAAQAHYLANAGVLITNGETKVVFDPLFRNDFGTYQLLPEALERWPVAMFRQVLPRHYQIIERIDDWHARR